MNSLSDGTWVRGRGGRGCRRSAGLGRSKSIHGPHSHPKSLGLHLLLFHTDGFGHSWGSVNLQNSDLYRTCRYWTFGFRCESGEERDGVEVKRRWCQKPGLPRWPQKWPVLAAQRLLERGAAEEMRPKLDEGHFTMNWEVTGSRYLDRRTRARHGGIRGGKDEHNERIRYAKVTI